MASSSSASSQLQISLEAPPSDRDPLSNRPLILYDYGEGGVPIWKQSVSIVSLESSPFERSSPPSLLLLHAAREASSEELLGKTVRRIWEEKGGLVNFTQQELNDKITREEQGDEQLPLPEEGEGDPLAVIEEMEQSLPLHREIDPEEMKGFKFQIAERLQ